MSNELLNAAWQIAGLRPTEKLVLVRLADRANGDGKCWPSLDGIATDCNINRATVIRAIQQLERMGHIEIDKGGGRRINNRYLVLKGRTLQQFEDGKQSQGATVNSRSVQQKKGETVAFCSENSRTLRPEPSVNPHSDSTQRKTGEPRARVNGAAGKQAGKTGEGGLRLVPEDWQPDDELIAWVKSNFPHIPIEDELAKFRDRSRAKGDRFADIAAGFRGWIRRAHDFAKRDGKAPSGGSSRKYLN